MGNITLFKNAGLPDFLIASDGVDNSEYSHGAGEGFGVLSLKGRIWRLKHKGEEHMLTKNGEPITRLNVVLVRANKNYSKIFYEKKYAEGDDAPPDCWSSSGTSPDSSVEKPRAKTCEVCPNNVWGSRVNDNGTKGKACQDSRCMAVLLMDPDLDVSTEEPVLLRIPPASLGELKTYSDGMSKAGVALWKVITQLSFDLSVAYPKLQFKAYGWDESQVEAWGAMRDNDVVKRILDTSEEAAVPKATAGAVRAPVTNVSDEGEDDDTPPPPPSKAADAAPQPKPQKKATTPKAAKVAPPPPPPEDDDGDGVEAVGEEDVDAMVNQLLGAD